MAALKLTDRFEGCLLGLAVGDAFGASFEGRSPEAMESKFRGVADLLGAVRGRNWHYTDDTQMAIGVAEALCERGEIDNAALCRRFAENFDPYRGYGRGARLVIEAMIARHDHQYLANHLFPGGSFGNGAAMRVAPIGLLFHDDHQRLWDQARLSALPTHTHPLGIEGAQLLALAIALAISTERIDADSFCRILEAKATAVEYQGPLSRAAQLKDVRDLGLFGNGIEATESVVTAIASFVLHSRSYVDTVASVVLLGGDTDTLAAMAGAISGAHLGVQAIPAGWLDRLEDEGKGRTYIRGLAQQLAQRSEKRSSTGMPSERGEE